MSLLDKLERKYHKFSIPYLTIILIGGQVIFFSLIYLKVLTLENVILDGNKIYAGEYWRLITFLFIPITNNIIFVIFTWYIYYLYGTALENTWGTFKYNVYIFLSYLLTISISFIMPDSQITNTYIYLTIFLAFAYLCPDFQLYIFFIIPVKIKWLALILWISYVIILIFGEWINKILLVVSLGNFFLFFGKDIVLSIKHNKWKMKNHINNIKKKNTPLHKCTVCGITDLDDSDMQFRYCDDCGDKCYCINHIDNHPCTK